MGYGQRPHFWADLRIPCDSLHSTKALIRPNQVSTSGRQPQIGGSIDSQGGWGALLGSGPSGYRYGIGMGRDFRLFKPQILPTYSESPNLEDPRIVQLEEPPKNTNHCYTNILTASSKSLFSLAIFPFFAREICEITIFVADVSVVSHVLVRSHAFDK